MTPRKVSKQSSTVLLMPRKKYSTTIVCYADSNYISDQHDEDNYEEKCNNN